MFIISMLGSKILTRIFRPKTNEITGLWDVLRNGKLHNVHLLNIIRVNKPTKMRLVQSLTVDLISEWRSVYIIQSSES
jgi:hypothetical protein